MIYYMSQSAKAPRRDFQFVTRDEWNAVEPAWVRFLKLPVEHVFFASTWTQECHDNDTCMQDIRHIQLFNLRLKENPDIIFNFLISSDGTVYEGRGWEAAPRLPPKWKQVNKKALYIAMIGSFKDSPPTKEMYQTRLNLITYGIRQKCISLKHLEYDVCIPEPERKIN